MSTSSKNRTFTKKWTFWLTIFDFTSNQFQYTIEEIGTINNLVNLHQYYRTLPQISEIKRNPRHYASIAFFCNEIKPAWEDPKNKDGAKYHFIVDERVVNDLWRDLLLCASGDIFEFQGENELCGVVVSPKKERRNYEFELWVKNHTQTPNLKIMDQICKLESIRNYKNDKGEHIKPENIQYSKHGQRY